MHKYGAHVVRRTFAGPKDSEWLESVEFLADGHRFRAVRVIHRDARPDSWGVEIDADGTVHLGPTNLGSTADSESVIAAVRVWYSNR